MHIYIYIYIHIWALSTNNNSSNVNYTKIIITHNYTHIISYTLRNIHNNTHINI